MNSFRNHAVALGACLPLSRSSSLIPLTFPRFLVVSCPSLSCWIRSHCEKSENSVSFLLTHGVQCLINNLSIFCAKCLSKSPLWMLRGSAIIHSHCGVCVEWHALCKDVVLFIMLASTLLLAVWCVDSPVR